MKKTVLFGLLVIALAFSLVGCGGDDGEQLNKSGTFAATIFSLNTSDYTSIFGTVPTSFTILSGTRNELITKVLSADSKLSHYELAGDYGLNWDQVEGTVQVELVGGGIISTANKNTLMNNLGTKGYVAGVIDLGGGNIGVAAAYRE